MILFKRHKISKFNFIFFFVLSFISIIVAFRTERFNDYIAYFEWFNTVPDFFLFFDKIEDLPYQSDYLFFFGMSFFRYFFNWNFFLFFIFYLSILTKYIVVKSFLNSYAIVVFFVFYFSFIGYQFELVQFRYGLALSFLFLYTYLLKKRYLIISLLIHSGILIVFFPIVAIFFSNIFSVKVVKKLLYILLILHVFVMFSSLNVISFFPFEYLPVEGFASGKLLNQFIFSTGKFSLFINFKLLFFIGLIFLTFREDLVNKRALIFFIFTYLIYILVMYVDNFNARVTPILDFTALVIILNSLNNKFKKFPFFIFILTISLIILLFSTVYFFNSKSMFV